MPKRLFLLAPVAVFSLGVQACGLGAVVDDINDALDEAAAQAKVEDAFSATITEVTLQVVAAVREAAAAGTAATAPGIGLQAEDATHTIDESTNEGGATVRVKGTVSSVDEGDTVTVSLDLEAAWENVAVLLEDGTQVATFGTQSVEGTFAMTSPEHTLTLNVTNKGNMTLEGESFAFEIVLTYDSAANSVSYTGTLNGKPVSKTVSWQAPQSTVYGSCTRDAGDAICYEYTGVAYSPWDGSACQALSQPYLSCEDGGGCQEISDHYTAAAMPCAMAAGAVGRCIVDAGTADEYTVYYSTYAKEKCDELGGEYVALEVDDSASN